MSVSAVGSLAGDYIIMDTIQDNYRELQWFYINTN